MQLLELPGGSAASSRALCWIVLARGSVGRIQGEDQLKIFNEQGEECKPGEVGEIFFRSAGGQGSAE